MAPWIEAMQRSGVFMGAKKAGLFKLGFRFAGAGLGDDALVSQLRQPLGTCIDERCGAAGAGEIAADAVRGELGVGGVAPRARCLLGGGLEVATLLLVLTTLASLPTLATAFKAADFKTCATSSFCARHRDRASSDRGAYRVAAGGFASITEIHRIAGAVLGKSRWRTDTSPFPGALIAFSLDIKED